MAVLMLATSRDPHAAALEEACGSLCVPVRRLNVDELAHRDWLTLAQSGRSRCLGFDLQDCTGVIYRRLGAVRSPAVWSSIAERMRRFAADESESALVALAYQLIDRSWTNPYWASLQADSKWRQSSIAATSGLLTPDTIITTSQQEIEAFYYKHDGRVVLKAVSQPLVWEDSGKRGFYYTTRVSAKLLSRLGNNGGIPLHCQQLVERSHELRVTVVGEEIFAARVDTESSDVDWRKELGRSARFSIAVCDDVLADRIRLLMRSLGLVYGAIDFIVDRDGSAYFLEVNPTGAYLWLETELGFPISRCIVSSVLS